MQPPAHWGFYACSVIKKMTIDQRGCDEQSMNLVPDVSQVSRADPGAAISLEVICALKCPPHEHPASGGLGAGDPRGNSTFWCLPLPARLPSVGVWTRCSSCAVGPLPTVLASHKLFIKQNH